MTYEYDGAVAFTVDVSMHDAAVRCRNGNEFLYPQRTGVRDPCTANHGRNGGHEDVRALPKRIHGRVASVRIELPKPAIVRSIPLARPVAADTPAPHDDACGHAASPFVTTGRGANCFLPRRVVRANIPAPAGPSHSRRLSHMRLAILRRPRCARALAALATAVMMAAAPALTCSAMAPRGP